MARLILRLDDGEKVILNEEVRPEVVRAVTEIPLLVEVFQNVSDAPMSGFWACMDGRSNHSPLYEEMMNVVFQLLSKGCGSITSESWRSGTAGLIVAQLAHIHGMAPLMPVNRERAARG